jgi:phosphatidylglycerol:prolipoprotein diacylglycerol transferase
MRPVLFEIGDFQFNSFGLMAALALIVPGLTVVRALVQRRGAPSEFAYELIIAAGVGGFVGARLYFMLENLDAVRADFFGVAFGGIGFTWYGGLIGGFVGVVLWTLIRRVPLDIVANAMAPATAMGYAIGRIGCHLSGDGDYGRPTDLPWAVGYPNGTVPTPPGVEVHPTPIYEIIAMAFVVWILWRLATRYDKSGWWTFGWFLVLSGIERFLVEFVRINPEWLAGLTQPQWVSIASVLIGVGLILAFQARPAVLVGQAARPGRAAQRRAARASGS